MNILKRVKRDFITTLLKTALLVVVGAFLFTNQVIGARDTLRPKARDEREIAGVHKVVSNRIQDRIVCLGDTEIKEIYQGAILYAADGVMYILSVGHDTKSGAIVDGVLRDGTKLRGSIIACKDDGEGRDISLTKMSGVPHDKKFEKVKIGYGPAAVTFETDIVFADYRDSNYIYDAINKIYTASALITRKRYEDESVDAFDINVKGIDLRDSLGKPVPVNQDGICGAPLFRNDVLIGLIHERGYRRLAGHCFAITGNAILSFLKYTEYAKILSIGNDTILTKPPIKRNAGVDSSVLRPKAAAERENLSFVSLFIEFMPKYVQQVKNAWLNHLTIRDIRMETIVSAALRL